MTSIEPETKWFETYIQPYWTHYLCDQPDDLVTKYLEIGVGEGHSARWVMENLKPNSATLVDPHAGSQRRYRKTAIRNLQEFTGIHWVPNHSFTYLLGESRLAQANWPEYEPFDLIYVDGSHTGVGTLQDLVLSFSVLCHGGLIIIDDYHRRWHHGSPHTREAVQGWLQAYEGTYEILFETQRQIAVEKISDEPMRETRRRKKFGPRRWTDTADERLSKMRLLGVAAATKIHQLRDADD